MGHPRRLVLALGNPLAGDDGFGRAVVDELRQHPDLLGSAQVRDVGTDLLGVIDELAGCAQVVLVDAVVGSGRAGEVTVFEETEFRTWPAAPADCHAMDPLTALALFRRLYPDAPTRFTVVALQSPAIRLRPGVSADAVARGVELVVRLLQQRPPAGPEPAAT